MLKGDIITLLPQSPQTFDDYNFEKGVNFMIGKLGDINIDKLTLYGDGLSIRHFEESLGA